MTKDLTLLLHCEFVSDGFFGGTTVFGFGAPTGAGALAGVGFSLSCFFTGFGVLPGTVTTSKR